MAGSSTATSENTPAWYQTAGITLAILAGFFTGCSMILQKKGLLATRKIVLETGNEFAYLKNGFWWSGILSLAFGEVANFVAYAFSPAILVAPLMAISVVVSAIMSVFYLNEKLNFTATSGIILCLLGSIIIVLHAPSSNTTNTLPAFFSNVFSPGFLAYLFLCTILLLYLVFRLGPRYGHVHPAVYLSTTAIGGAYLVCSAQGLGAAILYSISNWETDNQFLLWEFYPLTAFVIASCLFQVKYLNKALACFSASIVTPLNYVFFSTATIVTSSVLYKGFNVDSIVIALTIVMGFLVIVVGVALLFQYNLKMSKLALMSRHIIDINDEEVVLETPADDDPFKLMSEMFPVDPSKYKRSSARVRPLETRLADGSPDLDGNPDNYVRVEEPDPTIAHPTDTMIVPNNIIPQVSLSQQIQQRTDMMTLASDQIPSITSPDLNLLIPISKLTSHILPLSGTGVPLTSNQVTIDIPAIQAPDQSTSDNNQPKVKTNVYGAGQNQKAEIGDIESVYEEGSETGKNSDNAVGVGITIRSEWQPPGGFKG